MWLGVGDVSGGGVPEAGAGRCRGQRKPREISVETYPSRLEQPREDWGLLPAHKSERPHDSKPSEGGESEQDGEQDDSIGFFSGNPFVELTKGILHLYKEDVLSDAGREDAVTLCLLGVPATMSCHDLLAFTAPCHQDIAHIRVLRDATPNQYMALLTFRQHPPAMEFYSTYNGAPFSGLEPELVCRAVWVSRVEWAESGADRPPPGHTELPTCPVCLERMDESVDGVLTILCNHAFHADCLLKWGDATCPVCRCVQSPELAEGGECMRCGATAPDSLWICLICGHVGCGRYQAGHAAGHWRESGHCYALQLGSHRVWDYKGDNFVHRLLQNKADGKLVPAGGGGADREGERAHFEQEKVDAVQLEFTYLLTSQLDTQRQYFEERLSRVEQAATTEAELLRERIAQLQKQLQRMEESAAKTERERQAAERRVSQLSQRLSHAHTELTDERQLGAALRSNQHDWQQKLSKLESRHQQMRLDKDSEIAELKEQIRDLMFYIDAGRAISESADREDIAAGTVTVPTTTDDPHRSKNKKGRKKR